MLFFATGATWAAFGVDLTLGRLKQHRKQLAIWLPSLLYAISIAVFLLMVQFYPEVWLARVLCFLVGASLFTSLLGSL